MNPYFCDCASSGHVPHSYISQLATLFLLEDALFTPSHITDPSSIKQGCVLEALLHTLFNIHHIYIFTVHNYCICVCACVCFGVCPMFRCLIKDFELRPNVQDLLQHAFIKQVTGQEETLQKQLTELIELNHQIGVIEKTRYLQNYIS